MAPKATGAARATKLATCILLALTLAQIPAHGSKHHYDHEWYPKSFKGMLENFIKFSDYYHDHGLEHKMNGHFDFKDDYESNGHHDDDDHQEHYSKHDVEDKGDYYDKHHHEPHPEPEPEPEPHGHRPQYGSHQQQQQYDKHGCPPQMPGNHAKWRGYMSHLPSAYFMANWPIEHKPSGGHRSSNHNGCQPAPRPQSKGQHSHGTTGDHGSMHHQQQHQSKGHHQEPQMGHHKTTPISPAMHRHTPEVKGHMHNMKHEQHSVEPMKGGHNKGEHHGEKGHHHAQQLDHGDHKGGHQQTHADQHGKGHQEQHQQHGHKGHQEHKGGDHHGHHEQQKEQHHEQHQEHGGHHGQKGGDHHGHHEQQKEQHHEHGGHQEHKGADQHGHHEQQHQEHGGHKGTGNQHQEKGHHEQQHGQHGNEHHSQHDAKGHVEQQKVQHHEQQKEEPPTHGKHPPAGSFGRKQVDENGFALEASASQRARDSFLNAADVARQLVAKNLTNEPTAPLPVWHATRDESQNGSSLDSVQDELAARAKYLGLGDVTRHEGSSRTQVRLSCLFDGNSSSIGEVTWSKFEGNRDPSSTAFACQQQGCRVTPLKTDTQTTIHARPLSGQPASYSVTLHEVEDKHLGVYRCSASRRGSTGQEEHVYRIIPLREL